MAPRRVFVDAQRRNNPFPQFKISKTIHSVEVRWHRIQQKHKRFGNQGMWPWDCGMWVSGRL